MLTLPVYKLITATGLPFLLLAFGIRSLKQRAYRYRLTERLGWHQFSRRGGIMIHAASVGEVIALRPVVEALLKEDIRAPITITTFTPTGSDQVKALFGTKVQHGYLPIDSEGAVKSFLERLNPLLIVIMETEIWPNLIHQAHENKIKTLLINGRISSRSFPRYQKIPNLIEPTLAKLDSVLAQSPEDAERLIALGASKHATKVSGNIKYDVVMPASVNTSASLLSITLKNRLIWTIGSSHEDEEDLLFEAYGILREKYPDMLCVLAPRHPERISDIVAMAEEKGYKLTTRSSAEPLSQNTDIWLIDTMGELLIFYSIANICTVAGSFGETGGHNPLEAALFEKPVIVGPNMANFNEIAGEFDQAQAWKQVGESSPEALAEAVSSIIEDPIEAKALGERAKTVLKKNQGAAQTTVQAIKDLWSYDA